MDLECRPPPKVSHVQPMAELVSPIAQETYNYDQSLYFLLELALGGELYATYNKKNLWGNATGPQPASCLFILEACLHLRRSAPDSM